MEKIYDSIYSFMHYDEKNALTEHVWLSASSSMKNEEFRETVRFWKDFVIANQVKYHLLDTLNFQYSLSPAMQDWVAVEMVKPAVASGLLKMATILPDVDIFAQVSVDQTIEENTQQGGVIAHYFHDREEARIWLMD